MMKEIAVKEWAVNPFTSIGDDWMLITAAKGDKVNTMTASWGGMGVLWNYNVAYIFIRQTRYTKQFVDAADTFSLTFFPQSERKTLGYMGRVSGRDEDKIATAGYHVVFDGGTPYFDEAHTAVICTKLSKHPIAMETMPKDVCEKWYADGNCHDMYVARIDKVLIKD